MEPNTMMALMALLGGAQGIGQQFSGKPDTGLSNMMQLMQFMRMLQQPSSGGPSPAAMGPMAAQSINPYLSLTGAGS